jgi:hypothetical protein
MSDLVILVAAAVTTGHADYIDAQEKMMIVTSLFKSQPQQWAAASDMHWGAAASSELNTTSWLSQAGFNRENKAHVVECLKYVDFLASLFSHSINLKDPWVELSRNS